jgi:hypothetical protein
MVKSIQKIILSGVSLAGLLLLAASLNHPAQAAPAAQLTPYATPTADQEGKIYYFVKKDDTLWYISAVTGVSVDQLRALNKLGLNDPITEGMKLLVGVAVPIDATPTYGPMPTSTPSTPTATPPPGWGVLCAMLYDDQNGDAIRQETEPSIPGGVFSVSNLDGSVSRTGETTTSSDPLCFEQLSEEEYTISVAIPDGYNPTTVTSRQVALKAGDQTEMRFGAQPKVETKVETQIIPEPPVSKKKSPLLGILGGGILLLGLGLGLYAGFLRLAGKGVKNAP